MSHDGPARLLILGARQAQRPLYEAAQRLGLRVLAADPDPAAESLSLAAGRWIGDLGDVDGLIRYARAERIDGVLTVAADFPMPALGRIAEALGLPGPSVAAVLRATNKAVMRAAFQAAALPSPQSALCDSPAALLEAAARMGGDCIAKPVQSSGGRGITSLPASATDGERVAAYEHAAAHTPDRRGVLLERYVDGPEYSVEGLVWGGRCEILAVTDKLTSGPPHFVELGHHQPASLDADARRQLAETAAAAAAAVGLDQCALHAELRLTADGPVLIECAARAGGGSISSRLLPLSTGIDFMEACIQIALGREPELRPRHVGGAAAVRFLTAPPGLLQGYEGLEAARTMPGVVEVQGSMRPGMRVGPLCDATARCGHVLSHCPGELSAAAVQQVVAQAEAARARIRVLTQ